MMLVQFKNDWDRKGTYKLTRPIEPCCADMQKALTEKVIGFGEYDESFNEDNTVNVYKWIVYPEGVWHEEMEINFCPFCGSRIEMEEVTR